MTQDEYNELKAQVDVVATQDVHLGRVLYAMLGHLGALGGASAALAPAVEAAPAEVVAAVPWMPETSVS